MTTARKGQAPGHLERAEFGARFRTAFFDPAFRSEDAAIARLEEIARRASGEGRKTPLTWNAGPGDADPEYEVSIEWVETRARLERAAAVEYPSCAVCGGARVEIVCDARDIRAQLDWVRRFHLRRLEDRVPRGAFEDRTDFTQSFVTNVVACAACGLLFRDPRPTLGVIARAYAHDAYEPARLDALLGGQRTLFRDKVRTLAHWMPPPGGRVLEVGSFVGGFLDVARDAGWDARGVDPGEEVVAYCRARGLHVVRGTVDELDEPAASFDLVAIWNTFDQLPDPGATLRVVARLLRHRGILVLRVPNGLCYRRAIAVLRRLAEPLADVLRGALAWNNLLGFPYLYGYTPPTMERLLTAHGFGTIEVRPDTLVRLSDETTRVWAVAEEALVKAGWRLLWSLPGVRAIENAPWLDVVLRRSES
ncbi:MAG: class I SAM-dependent methyltransferase [Deltaproteobacteria bacterium]|nr:MAG: class I SAM-dependent methyltransferase [Deltaproteobacteria bacterium]